ncbi:MAG: gamma-glutamyltransferase [Elusimicrobia bacterium]|nr:gamma-glutamyltransferase [Elusimicrobiota bacterium]
MKRAAAAASAALLLCACAAPRPRRASAPPDRHVARGRKGMIATVNAAASDAGLRVLKDGGNAVDAAVAAALTLGVVDGHNSGIGGGCFCVIRAKTGELAAVDGREAAPAASTRDMFLRSGKADAELSQTGALAIGVPGALAAYDLALKRFGTRRLADLLRPAADLAEAGFVLDGRYADVLKTEADKLARFPASKSLLLKPDGTPLQEGDLLRQPDLAATYRAIAERGVDWFYRGPFAERLDVWMRENGGVLTARDLAVYEAKLREPVRGTYRGYDIVSFPPPSSGGVHVIEILNILERFDVRSMTEAERLHVAAEAMKLAFADRAHWLGDPAFAKVPTGLVEKSYAGELAARLRTDRATPVASHGVPPDAETRQFRGQTTHVSAADADGTWAACTATVNTGFGAKVVLPGTGVIMNDEMDDFAAQPGVRNFFGLVGAEANAVEGGKRPLSSMSPTLVLKDGRPVAALGAAGGPKIISEVALALVRMLDLGRTAEEALAAPRIHHQWSPDELLAEQSLPEAVSGELARRGHRLQKRKTLAIGQIVAFEADGGFVGAADPRVQTGAAAGW